MAEDLTLAVLWRDLLRRWRVALAITAAPAIGATAYAQSLPNEYQSEVVVAFSPRRGETVSGDTIRVILPKYVEYVTARVTVGRVAGTIGERPGPLASAVDASITPDSGNLAIRVTLPSSRRAAQAANALAADTVAFADTDELLRGIIVAPAVPDDTPSGPPRRLLSAAALVVGALLGAAAAFALERSRPRVRNWRDVAVVTGYTVLGRVPLARALRGSVAEAMDDPVVGAAVRTLRTNLERASRDDPVHSLVVTSSVAGEGKTTVASALAVALARLDAQVLLLDADLRRPSVNRAFFGGGPVPVGVRELLRGEATLEEALRPGPVANLWVVPTAPEPDAGDLLAKRFSELLTTARSRFDVVVVDAPPVLGGDDARTLAALTDAVLMVVATDALAASTAEAAAVLDALAVRVLGVVANRARNSRGFGTYGAYGVYDIVTDDK